MSDHIIITGTGRAGTTFLVQLFTSLGLDTGYDTESMMKVDVISNAGLEHSICEDNLPYIVKSPNLITELVNEFPQDKKILLAVVPMREIYSAAKSRIRVSRIAKNKTTHPGGMVGTTEEPLQAPFLAMQFYSMMWLFLSHDIPYLFTRYPDFVINREYCYRSLESFWTMHNIDKDTLFEHHEFVSDPKLIGDYRG